MALKPDPNRDGPGGGGDWVGALVKEYSSHNNVVKLGTRKDPDQSGMFRMLVLVQIQVLLPNLSATGAMV